MVEFEKININQIKPALYNPRIMKPSEALKLKNNLETFGLVDPIIIDLTDNNTVIGGHQRLEALKEIDDDMNLKLLRLGDIGLIFRETELHIKDKNDQKALNLSLNKIQGEWDWGKLEPLLDGLNNDNYLLDLTGFDDLEIEFDDSEFDDLFPDGNELQTDKEITNTQNNNEYTHENQENKKERNHNALKDRIDVEPIKTTIKEGDLFKLGPHRLLCGNSTSEQNLIKLLDNTLCDIQFSSPPYNIKDSYEKSKYLNNDLMTNDEYLNFLTDTTRLSIKYCSQSFINIQHLSSIKKVCLKWLYNFSDNYCTTIIWHKLFTQPFTMTDNVLKHDYENIHVFSKKGNSTVGTIPNKRGNSDLITTPKQNKNKYALYHNATFPTDLAEKILENFCNKTVLDMFGGTGTTLIASEKTNKKCYMMEIDPRYCQIIIDRWEKYTGQKAKVVEI